MRKILIVIDMQNDFIDMALGTKEAVAIVDKVKNRIRSYSVKDVIATMDTHEENYPETQEGAFLPVEHYPRYAGLADSSGNRTSFGWGSYL
jgi:nicotinamidase-related amidase